MTPENCLTQEHTEGYSLMEVVFSIAIISAAILILVGLFTIMFRSSQKGVDLTIGTVVASSELAKYLYTQQEAPGGLENLDTDGFPPYRGTVTLNRTVFSYEIRSFSVGSHPDLEDLRKVDISVWWWQETPESLSQEFKPGFRPGYGRLNVKLSRIVYTKEKVRVVP